MHRKEYRYSIRPIFVQRGQEPDRSAVGMALKSHPDAPRTQTDRACPTVWHDATSTRSRPAVRPTVWQRAPGPVCNLVLSCHCQVSAYLSGIGMSMIFFTPLDSGITNLVLQHERYAYVVQTPFLGTTRNASAREGVNIVSLFS